MIIIWMEQRKYQKELSEISRIIENMINQEDITKLSTTSEYLASKIQHQIEKLHATLLLEQNTVKKDRDEIRTLISDIAHQLRTPLSNMRLYLDLLDAQADVNEEQRLYLDNIELAVDNFTFLTESFIKMSRLDGKVMQLKQIEQSLNKTLQMSITTVLPKAKEKNIGIQYDNTKNIMLSHDTNWMQEALYNILENAVKYTDTNGKVIVTLQENNMFVEIVIEDNGIGIQSGEENEIFKRFYRGKNVMSQPGFGIGLYLSRSIVLLHNGFIKVKKIKIGTKFTIYLPK
ncbi:MAG: sensor histidine kinase [Coprobacillaceae bacterium]